MAVLENPLHRNQFTCTSYIQKHRRQLLLLSVTGCNNRKSTGFKSFSIEHPVIIGGLADNFFEIPGEMLRVLKSQFKSDLTNRFTMVKYFFFGDINYFQLYVLLRCFSCLSFYQVTKITR